MYCIALIWKREKHNYTVSFVLEKAQTKISYGLIGKWFLEKLPFFLSLHSFTNLLNTFSFDVPDFYLEGVS